MKFSPDGKKLLTAGRAPILMEPVKASLTLRKPGSPRVTILDHDGRPTGKTVPVTGNTFQIDGQRDRTPYYLVTWR
jgi:hypothetical protein